MPTDEEIFDLLAEANGYDIEILKQRREKECFAIVNRGEKYWKKLGLTEEQEKKFDVWYDGWLDVTRTKEVPPYPQFFYDLHII